MQWLPAFDFGAMNLKPIDWAGLTGLLLLGLVLAIVTLVLTLRKRLLEPPRRTLAWAVSRSWPATPAEMDEARFGTTGVPWRHIEVRARDGKLRLSVWEITGRLSTGPTAVLTHGWADSKLSALARIEPLLDTCSRVIAWDLPGHGESSGVSEMGRSEHDLLDRVLDEVLGEEPSTPLVLVGWSLGAGVSMRYAATGRRAAMVQHVIAEAPYVLPQTPALRVAQAAGMPGFLVRPALALIGGLGWMQVGGSFDRRGYAKRMECPLTILHGEADPVCPIEDGQTLAQAAKHGSLLQIAGARHNDLWINPVYRAQCNEKVKAVMQQMTMHKPR